MGKYIVIMFHDEEKAYEGTRVLRDLHTEGSLSLYGVAVITKNADGTLSVKRKANEGPLGMAVGGLVGGLVGLLGGPIGATVGIAGGALFGGIRDLFNAGVGTTFLQKVSDDLAPGTTAVIADIAEDWVIPLDSRMEAIGGSVVREWRSDFEEDLIAREAADRRLEEERLIAEFSHAKAEMKAKLRIRLDDAHAKVSDISGRAQTGLEMLKRETDARIGALKDQLAKAHADTKMRIEQRIDELTADRDRRAAKLKKAWELTKEAVAA
ncbi:MAG: DUF1269 domain-containing protein [Rhodoplanes sp.]|uniref:DUF1269 domain-containing protein n=1 Tax=Rhodoplanes sp. TaxID=1968906 RepID=UPI0017A340BF|nr:DUF1269 domain-containing protein [Rhodoplanes sp.]NVO16930.1 DUF1269 domain-containing protein [Rhodoplanes sp.]